MFVILFSVSGEWRLLADLPDNLGYPVYLNPSVSGGYVIGFTSLIRKAFRRSEVEVFPDGSLSEPVSLPQASASGASTYEVICSNHNSFENEISAVMISLSGDTLWTTSLMEFHWSGEYISIVMPSSTGGCFVVYKADNGGHKWDLFKLDSTGEIAFQSCFTISGGPVLSMHDMVETSDGGIVMTGVTDDFGMNLYMFLIGFDGEGNSRFFERDSLHFHASGEHIQTDLAGNLVVCGYTGYERNDGFFMPPADTDVFLKCIDPSGDELWHSVFPLPQENSPLVMFQDTREGSIALVVTSFPEDFYGEDPMYSLAVFKPE